jgi:DNA-directed RNA polymerase sigma subunit (sigma70/sigma32)
MSLNAKVRDTNDRTELGDIVPDQRFDPEEAVVETSVCRDIADAMQRLLTEREQRFLSSSGPILALTKARRRHWRR